MRNLTFRQLRSFQTIVRTGRIGEAAQALGLTGPAVTLQLKQMEDEAGLSLFARTPDGMLLTPAGEAVARSATLIQQELRVLEEALEAIRTGQRGTLRLGAVSTAKYFVPRMIAAYRNQNPDIEIDLFIGNRSETITALRNRDVDIALMGRPPRDFDVNALVFGDHPLVIVAPPGHRLARQRDITKEELAGERFLLREPGSGTRTSLEIFFADVPGKLDRLGPEMGSNETIKQAVMAGLGIAFLSAHTIELELELNRLVILDVVGMPVRRQWYAIERSDRTPTAVMTDFKAFLARDGLRHLPVTPKTYPESMTATPEL